MEATINRQDLLRFVSLIPENTPSRLLMYKINGENSISPKSPFSAAEQLLEKSSLTKCLIEEVSNLILTTLATGRVSIDFISQELNMSRQTLCRRLKEFDTSFTEIFNQIQKDLSLKYQHSGNYPQLEIAFLLDFSDGSSYNRARKKWKSE